MDPLSAFVVAVLGSVAAQSLETRAKAREFYPKSASNELEPYRGWVRMSGEKVDWFVEPGQAVWIDSRYVRPIEGNLFDPRKLGAVARELGRRRRGDRMPFMAGYGQVYRLTPSLVAETIAYRNTVDTLPWTTGNEELDDWLGREYNGDTDPDEDEEMEEVLEVAVREGWGDLGRWAATVRDGNHRTFGAILGGEPMVAIRLYDNDVEDIRDGLRTGSFKGNDLALLKKAVTDTQGRPYWLAEEQISRFSL